MSKENTSKPKSTVFIKESTGSLRPAKVNVAKPVVAPPKKTKYQNQPLLDNVASAP